MDSEQFKEFASAMATYIVQYLDNIRDRRVSANVEPGYLRPLIPSEAPNKPEKWTDVMADIERVIMPGVTHWQSPHFHAYFSAASSFPAIVADMLSGAISCIAFTWLSSPAYTELEVVMLDWLGKMLGLPETFLSSTPGGHGGGVIQGTASEATLIALLGAKAKKLQEVKQEHPEWADAEIVSKLVGYTSEQAHYSAERAGLLCGIKIRLLKVFDRFSLRGDPLEKAIQEDKANGLIPFYVVATLGTTSVCSFDNLEEIGPVCEKEKVWLHVDAAYAGSAFICPEFRYLMKGVEFTDSFSFNPYKWMLVNFDCSAMWLKNPNYVVNAYRVDPVYVTHGQRNEMPDYRHWQVGMGRRFRSLKLWFVLRLMGVEYLQNNIRTHVGLAHEFERFLLTDPRFELFGEVIMGLACFRLKGSNDLNEKLLTRINGNGKIHLVPSEINGTYFLRFAICSRFTESKDIKYAWEEIKNLATEVSE